jgi:hypothetical protein
MQAIRPIAASTVTRIRSAQDPAEPTETTGPSECRAVIPIRPIAAGSPALFTRRYPLAGFLAHLIAVKQRAPQTRRRARTTPREAVAAYAAVQNMGPAAGHYRKSA